jgi:hypothetical protein
MHNLKYLAIVTALVVGGTSIALAQNGPATGGEPPVAGGAAGNSAAPGPDYLGAASPSQYVPRQYYNFYQGQGAAAGGTAWCQDHYRSFNPATGMYRGPDGRTHRCP